MNRHNHHMKPKSILQPVVAILGCDKKKSLKNKDSDDTFVSDGFCFSEFPGCCEHM